MLKDLTDWVGSWQLPEMYAGAQGGGVEMAWWQVAATREGAFHDSEYMLSGALGIYK